MDNNEITIQLLRGILETETEILKAIKMSDLLSTREAAEMLHTSGTRIDELRRSGILHGAKIGKGAKVIDSVLMPGVCVGDGAVVTRALVADDVKISAGAVVGSADSEEITLQASDI